MTTDDTTTLRLRAGPTPLRELLADLIEHRDLLPLLAQQHFRGQFRAARLGVAWSAIQPLLRGAVLAVVFTQVTRFDTAVPYAAFIFAGTATFTYLSTAITQGTTGITASSDLATKVYFPRLLLPAMPAAAALPSYLITLTVVVGLTFVFGVAPSWTLVTLPLSMGLGFALVTAAASVLALAHVYFRDVSPMVTTGMGIAFYATPVIYPIEAAPGWLADFLPINPFAGAVGAVRWSLFGGAEQLGTSVWWTLGWTVVLTVVAAVGYRHHERVCVDRM